MRAPFATPFLAVLALATPARAAVLDEPFGEREEEQRFEVRIKGRQCGREGVHVQTLGAGGPEADDGQASSGYLVWVDGRARVLIDVGGGVPVRLEEAEAELRDLEVIAFTHLHADHSAGFPALVKSAYFTDRDRDLPVYGPAGNDLIPGLVDWVNLMVGARGAYRYLSDVLTSLSDAGFKIVPYEVPAQGRRVRSHYRQRDISLSAVPVDHGPIPALAWRVDTETISVTFTGDASNDKGTIAELAEGSHILVAHHAIPENARGTARKLHMPPSQIGKIAADADVDMLILSHRMNRTRGRESESRREIARHFGGPILFANDLECWGL